MTDNTKPKIDPRTWPLATMFAVFFTLFAGVVHVVDQSVLNFDEYTTQVVGLWSAIAIGRGLAKKAYDSVTKLHPFDRFLNTFSWATAVVGIVAVVGYIGTLGGSLDVDELGTKLAVLIGALGVGRGIGKYKDDNVNIDNTGDDGHHVDPTTEFIPNGPTEVLLADPSKFSAAPVHHGFSDPLEEDELDSPEIAAADQALKLAVANGEVADPTAPDPEVVDEDELDNSEALEDVYGDDMVRPEADGAEWLHNGTVEGTEHAPTTAYKPDPETLP